MKKTRTFKIIIVGLAVLNLIALFGFDYKLPFINRQEGANSEIINVTSTPDYNITFDTAEISYDGTGELNLMNGVVVTGPEGVVENAEVYANIVTADEPVIPLSDDSIHFQPQILSRPHTLSVPEPFLSLPVLQLAF